MKGKKLGMLAMLMLLFLPWQVLATTPPYEEEFIGTANTKVVGWMDATDNSDFNATLQYADTASRARVTRTTVSNWGKILSPTLVVTVGTYTGMDTLEIKIDGISPNVTWKLGLQEIGNEWRHWTLQESSSATGTLSFNYSTIAQLAPGTYSFAVEIIVEGSGGEYIQLDRLSVASGNGPVFTATPTPSPTWTPTPSPTWTATPTPAVWELLAGDINKNPLSTYADPRITLFQSLPCVIWTEGGEIFVKRFQAGQWVAIGGALNADAGGNGSQPALLACGQNLFAAWLESGKVRVKYYDGVDWILDSAGINHDVNQAANGPRLAAWEGVLYASWVEADKVYVKKRQAGVWDSVGDAVNLNSSLHAKMADITIYDDGTPCVIYREEQYQWNPCLYVREFHGQWRPLGGNLFPADPQYASTISIASDMNKPYVFFNFGVPPMAVVQSWNGGSWDAIQRLSYSVNEGANGTGIKNVQGRAYAVWAEGGVNNDPYQIYVKYSDGAWKSYNPTALNISTAQDARIPDLAVEDNTLYVVWQEAGQLYVKKLLDPLPVPTRTSTPICSPTVTPSVTTTFTVTPTITSSPVVTPTTTATVTPSVTSTSTVTPTNTPSLEGQSLNLDAGQNAYTPSVAVYQGIPYVAWQEGGRIYVKHWDGNAWTQDGASLNVESNLSAVSPKLAVNGSGVPYVTWQEAGRIYVKHWNGGVWVQDGGSLNVAPGQSATDPNLAIGNDTLYVTWAEYNGTASQVYVKRWEGGAWVQVGGGLNTNPGWNAANPSLAVENGTPGVAWLENNGTANQLFVKLWNGSTWVHAGGSLNLNTTLNASDPSFAMKNGLRYVAWVENKGLYVKHWNGGAWVLDGDSLNVDAIQGAHAPSMAISQGTVYVAWCEDWYLYGRGGGYAGTVVYEKHWDGNGWVLDGTFKLHWVVPIYAQTPSLAFADAIAYIAWSESWSEWPLVTPYQVFVKHYQPGVMPPITLTSSPTAIPTFTATPGQLSQTLWVDNFSGGTPGAMPGNWFNDTATIAYDTVNGYADITQTSAAGYGGVNSIHQIVDLTICPNLDLQIASLTPNCSVVVQLFLAANPNAPFPDPAVQPSIRLFGPGRYTFDIPSLTGLNGVQDLGIRLTVEGPANQACAVVDWVRLFSPDSYWLEGFNGGAVGAKPSGWLDAADDATFNANIAYGTSSIGKITRTSSGTWGKVLSPLQTVDVSMYPVVEVNIAGVSSQASWKLGIQEIGGSWNHWVLKESSSDIGKFYINFQNLNGWSGVHDFRIEIIAESNLAGEYVDVDYVRICQNGSVQGSAMLGAFHFHPSTKTPTPTVTATATPTPKNTMTQYTMTFTPTPTVTPTSTPWLSTQEVMAYPNPARGKVMFAYTASGPITVTLDLYKINGERVAHIIESKDGGLGQTLTTIWEAADVAPGIYISRLVIRDTANGVVLDKKKKVALIK